MNKEEKRSKREVVESYHDMYSLSLFNRIEGLEGQFRDEVVKTDINGLEETIKVSLLQDEWDKFIQAIKNGKFRNVDEIRKMFLTFHLVTENNRTLQKFSTEFVKVVSGWAEKNGIKLTSSFDLPF